MKVPISKFRHVKLGQGELMNYRHLKNQSRTKVDVRQLDDFDLYFEKVPVGAAYKLRRAMKRNLRKLKFA
jgi:hypothetical protein